jgi:hypothetical protein
MNLRCEGGLKSTQVLWHDFEVRFQSDSLTRTEKNTQSRPCQMTADNLTLPENKYLGVSLCIDPHAYIPLSCIYPAADYGSVYFNDIV